MSDFSRIGMMNQDDGPGFGELNKYVKIDPLILDDLIANVEFINDATNSIQRHMADGKWNQRVEQLKKLDEDIGKMQMAVQTMMDGMRTIIAKADQMDSQTRYVAEFIEEANALREWWKESFDEFRETIITQAVFKTGEI